MSFKHLIVSSVAAIAVALSGVGFAETASDQATAAATQERANAATDAVTGQTSGTAEDYKHMKVDEATAADAKFHANRTEANMLARDKAEAEAAAAAGMPHPRMDQTSPR
jgi:hypothetical protein